MRAGHVLHVLDRLAVPLVVERREVVGRRVPLIVNVLVAARAHRAGHEEIRGNDPAYVRVGRRGEEGAVRTTPFLRHGQRRHEGVLNAVCLAPGGITACASRDRGHRRDHDKRDGYMSHPRPAAAIGRAPQRRAEHPRPRRRQHRMGGDQRRLRSCRADDEDADARDEAKRQQRRRDETDESGPEVSNQRPPGEHGQGQAHQGVECDVNVIPQRCGGESVEIRRADQQDDERGGTQRHRSPLASDGQSRPGLSLEGRTGATTSLPSRAARSIRRP